MKTQATSDSSAAIEAAQWIGFSEEVVQAFRAPTAALQPAIDFLKRLPEVRAFHAARGIPETVTKATLSDMELWLRYNRQKNGVWGFDQIEWTTKHFTGKLYALGRLQFEIAEFNLPVLGVLTTGEPILDVHIPATGKLDDAACGQAFRQACEFFPRHFPEHKFKAFTCKSWMMDRQLECWLPAESNLVRFVRRFHPLPPLPDATDEQMWERVFGERVANLATAPRDTVLQRAMLDHIADGGQWRMAAGYILREEIR